MSHLLRKGEVSNGVNSFRAESFCSAILERSSAADMRSLLRRAKFRSRQALFHPRSVGKLRVRSKQNAKFLKVVFRAADAILGVPAAYWHRAPGF